MRLGADRLLLTALLAVLGAGEAFAVYWWNPAPRVPIIQLAYGVLTAAIVLYLGRADRSLGAPRWTAPAVVAAAFILSALVARYALESFPISGDEYGYNYLAQTLGRGRLWNPAFPEPLRDVLQTSYIGGYGDKRLAQYPPAWPAVLVPFQALGLPQFAAAVVGLGGALFMWLALRDVSASRNVRVAMLALYVAAPFTVFNDASYYNHTLAALLLLAIIWLDGRDRLRPDAWNRAGIGLAFSIMLATRYEVVALCAVPFAADALLRHRLRFFAWVLPAALAAIPLTLAFLAYNWRITGSPFLLTAQWISPQIGYGLHAMGVAGPHSAARAIDNTRRWFGAWQDFVPAFFLPLYAAALFFRLRAGSLRWFDLLFPAVVVFFFFFPDHSGFEYGPRYWHIGFVAMPLTLAAALPAADGLWRVFGLRLDPLRLALFQGVAFTAFAIGYCGFLYVRSETHLTPVRLAAIAPPNSMLLIGDVGRRYGPWQGYNYQLYARDYTRNGLDALGPVVVAIDEGDDRTALLCRQLPERAIYRMRLDKVGPGGSLQSVCNLSAGAPTTVTLER